MNNYSWMSDSSDGHPIFIGKMVVETNVLILPFRCNAPLCVILQKILSTRLYCAAKWERSKWVDAFALHCIRRRKRKEMQIGREMGTDAIWLSWWQARLSWGDNVSVQERGAKGSRGGMLDGSQGKRTWSSFTERVSWPQANRWTHCPIISSSRWDVFLSLFYELCAKIYATKKGRFESYPKNRFTPLLKAKY